MKRGGIAPAPGPGSRGMNSGLNLLHCDLAFVYCYPASYIECLYFKFYLEYFHISTQTLGEIDVSTIQCLLKKAF